MCSTSVVVDDLNVTRIGRNVIGGWESSGVLTLRAGFPFSVLSGLDYFFSGNGVDRADLIGDPSPAWWPLEGRKVERMVQHRGFHIQRSWNIRHFRARHSPSTRSGELRLGADQIIPAKVWQFRRDSEHRFPGGSFQLVQSRKFRPPRPYVDSLHIWPDTQRSGSEDTPIRSTLFFLNPARQERQRGA
jgi:hypothetical protein